jgi:hypothetical protein
MRCSVPRHAPSTFPGRIASPWLSPIGRSKPLPDFSGGVPNA